MPRNFLLDKKVTVLETIVFCAFLAVAIYMGVRYQYRFKGEPCSDQAYSETQFPSMRYAGEIRSSGRPETMATEEERQRNQK